MFRSLPPDERRLAKKHENTNSYMAHPRFEPDAPRAFPDEAFRSHIGILGKTGSGKTTTAKGFAEHLMDEGRRLCIIDPTGVWWGLRLLADGRTSGYPVVIFGGPHADLDISEASGSRLAEIVAAESFSCIVDTSAMTVSERTRLFAEFAEVLHRLNSRPLHLIIDEAHRFAPQGRVPDPQSSRMLHAANDLVSGGRARGLRIMLISQRPAKLHKDSLTQVETLIALRLIAPQDRAAVEAWIGEWADPKQGKDVIASLPSLPRGTGWVWAPELGVLAKMAFPRIRTFDSSSAPEDGEPTAPPADLSAIDIASLREALAGIEPAVGRMAVPSQVQLKAAEERGYERGFAEGKGQGLQQAIASMAALLDELKAGSTPAPLSATLSLLPAPRVPEKAHEAPRARSRKGQPELRILRVLAARHPVRFTRAQWATLSGMRRTGGTWQTYVSRLRTAGFIDENGGTVGVTPMGLEAAGPVDRPAAGSVIQQWKSALGSGPSKMIDALMAVHPRGLDRADLADRTCMAPTGGTYQTYLSRLKSNGLIDVKGRTITLSDTLFTDDADVDPPVARFSGARGKIRR
jgi:hypothetical protein